MHTPIKLYLKTPVDLFRVGPANKPKFDYIRTMPPRNDDQRFDIKIDPKTNKIKHKTGGLSLFDKSDHEFSSNWWVIPAGTDLPDGFEVSKDLTNGIFKGHYTIRALKDIDLDDWKANLKEWAEDNAILEIEYLNNSSMKVK